MCCLKNTVLHIAVLYSEYLQVVILNDKLEVYSLTLQIWGVGEFMSTAYSDMCTAEMVRHMYETLEVLMYEIIGVTGSTPPSEAPYTINIVSVLMSTLAKVSCLCLEAFICTMKFIQISFDLML